MSLLIVGILLWSLVHLVPSLAPGLRNGLVTKMGQKTYRAVFTLAIVVSLVAIVIGWRSTPEEFVYVLPPGARIVAFVFICIALILIGAAHHPSSIKRVVRHPMLTGLFVWGSGHLVVNGSTRAIVLFGGLCVWALIEILAINRRDGAYEKPPKPDFGEELKGLFFSASILVLLLFLHPYFAGVSPFPR